MVQIRVLRVYWNKIFASTINSDPTFVLLSILWYALYAWDESFDNLYIHICSLEARVMSTNDMQLTQQLHIVRAHLLHYASLLDDFRKSILFVLETPNPVLDSLSAAERVHARELMRRECNHLLSEISRLEQSRIMQDKRLKNVMNLAFSTVNLEDSQRMQRMTEAAVRDSEAMKQISYLTMVFLPAGLVASIFGMNVNEINPGTAGTLPHYFAAAIPLTALTIWVLVAFQFNKRENYNEKKITGAAPVETMRKKAKRLIASIWARLWWPVAFLFRLFGQNKQGLARRRTFV